MAPPKKTLNPLVNFMFLVDAGTSQAGFSEVIIPQASVEVIEYREGGEAVTSTRKIAGRTSYGNLILKRGMSFSQDLYDWWEKSAGGLPERRNVIVSVLDASHTVVKRFNFRNAWPVRYEASDLNAKGNEVLIEELELTHEGMTVGV